MINMKDRRLELGLTLEQVGDFCGVGKSTVRKWQTGSIANMKRDKIALLAKVLQISPTDLLEFPDPQPISMTYEQQLIVMAYRGLNDTNKKIIRSIMTELHAGQPNEG